MFIIDFYDHICVCLVFASTQQLARASQPTAKEYIIANSLKPNPKIKNYTYKIKKQYLSDLATYVVQ